MDPRPPGASSNGKSPNGPPFHHSQYPQHPSFSQSPYAMNFPHQQFFQHHPYPHVQYVVVQPQYAPFPLPQQPPPRAEVMPRQPSPPGGVMSLPAPSLPPPSGVVPYMPVPNSGTPHLVTGLDEPDIASVNNNEDAEPDRAARRLSWTEVEDLRLINAWLNNSKLNNSKKNEVYWVKVTDVYNGSTPKGRRRTQKKLKNRWHNLNKKIVHFYDCWCRVKEKYSGVQSDNMQLMDQTWAMYNEEARAMYLEETKNHFVLSHFWKAVWDKPKWIGYISSLNSKRTKSESADYTSSSEDDDGPENEIGEQEGRDKTSSPSLELKEGIQCSLGPYSMMTGDHLQNSDQNLDSTRLNEMETMGKKATFDKQTDLAVAESPSFHEFDQGTEGLMPNSLRLNGFQHGHTVGGETKKKTHPQGCKDLERKERAVRGSVPEKETHRQVSKMGKGKRKRKGDVSSSSTEVQEDIKRAMDLQTMLQKDREKMSEVQLRLSKEKLELARLKQQEAQDKKETTLYEKYTELLTADTLRFNEFQKEEYEKAVRRMGEMLFGKDGM
ncbi:hypothetical protein ACP4OV_023813 [Aristida adscensionis]